MPTVRLQGPLRGNLDQFPHVDTPGDACPPGASLNVWPNTGTGSRKRIGRRDGVVKAFETQLGNGPVQVAGTVGRAARVSTGWGAPSLILGSQPVDEEIGETIPQVTPTTFSVSVYRPDGTRLREFVDPTDTTAMGMGCRVDNIGAVCAFGTVPAIFWTHVDKDYGGAVGVKRISRISVVNPDAPRGTGVITSFDVEDKAVGGTVAAGAVALEVIDAAIVGPYILALAGKYLYVFGYDAGNDITGGYLQRLQLTGNYVDKMEWIEVSVRTDVLAYETNGDLMVPYDATSDAYETVGNNKTIIDQAAIDGVSEPCGYEDFCWALVGYRGTRTVAGAVSSDTHAQGNDVRSGVAMIRVNLPRYHVTAYPTYPVQHGPIAGVLTAFAGTKTDNHGEASNIDFRPAEWFDTKGRVPVCGCIAHALSYQVGDLAGPVGGGIVLGHINDGFNSDNDPPDGSTGYWNMLFCDGDESRTVDVFSRRTDWQTTGWFSDKPWETDGDVPATETLGVRPSIGTIKAREYAATPSAFPLGLPGLYVAGGFSDGETLRLLPSPTSGLGTRATFSHGEYLPRRGMDYVAYGPRGTNLLVTCTKRNSTWDGASGTNASIWVHNPLTLAVTKAIDLGVGFDARMVAASRNNWFMVAHEHVT